MWRENIDQEKNLGRRRKWSDIKVSIYKIFHFLRSTQNQSLLFMNLSKMLVKILKIDSLDRIQIPRSCHVNTGVGSKVKSPSNLTNANPILNIEIATKLENSLKSRNEYNIQWRSMQCFIPKKFLVKDVLTTGILSYMI